MSFVMSNRNKAQEQPWITLFLKKIQAQVNNRECYLENSTVKNISNLDDETIEKTMESGNEGSVKTN